jgi:hypothetical protein
MHFTNSVPQYALKWTRLDDGKQAIDATMQQCNFHKLGPAVGLACQHQNVNDLIMRLRRSVDGWVA